MGKLAKEATTMRRILESLFRCFDNENHWPASSGVAFPVLNDMQNIIDESGINYSWTPLFRSFFFFVCFTSNKYFI